MTDKLKTDFEKIIETSGFSERDVKLKKGFLNKFIDNGFPSRKLENWKFLDINQIIQKNIGELSFYNDYSSSNQIDKSIFILLYLLEFDAIRLNFSNFDTISNPHDIALSVSTSLATFAPNNPMI